MSLYWHIFKYNTLRAFFYPYGILNDIFLRVESIFLIIFWGLVSQSTSGGQSFVSIISYFLISGFVNELIMSSHLSVGNLIRKKVKSGALSHMVIRPVNVMLYVYFELLGERGFVLAQGFIFFVIGILLLGSFNAISLLLFIINLIFALFTSLSINSFLASYSIGVTHKGDLKNVFNHINRLLSGAMVPLTFFPDTIKQILLLLPFQNMIFGPVSALSITQINQDVLKQLLVNLIWTIVLVLLAIYFWKKSMKNYDAVAI